MPNLNVLTVCERIIIDAKGIPSLISLFQRMEMLVPEITSPFPTDAVAPGKWVVFCVWQLSPDEAGKDFVQRSKVTRPDGVVFAEFTQPFRVEAGPDMQAKTYVEIVGIPVGLEGPVKITTWLEGMEEVVHECHFIVQFLVQPTATGSVLASTPVENDVAQPGS